MINGSRLVEVKGGSQLNCVKGAVSTSYPMLVDKIALRFEVMVEHSYGVKKTLIDVSPKATLKLTMILSSKQPHSDLLGKPRAKLD
jgi:hypothetical protein